jgi:hypothetical protein
MVYEEIVSLDDLLVFAHLSDRVDDLTEIMGKPIPLWYGVTFYFKKKDKQSETKDKAWSAIFKIRVTDETPELFSVEISGVNQQPYPIWALEMFDKRKKLTEAQGKKLVEDSQNRIRESVQRYQTDTVAKFQTQLFDRAVLIGLQNPHKLQKDQPVYNEKDLKALTKEIQKTTRRKVTSALLKQVAEIYLQAETSFPKGKPIEDIKDTFNVSHRRAQEYAQLAREANYLPSPQEIKDKVKKKQTKKKAR